jgi:endoglucanase
MCRILRKFAFLLLLLHTMVAVVRADAMDETAVVEKHLSHVRRGLNLTGWFALVGDPSGYSKEHFETAITAEDLALIREMGFDHVRLCVDPRPMFHPAAADEISSPYLGYLDAAIKMLLDQGLSVEIDIQPDSDFKRRLERDDFVEKFTDFWRALARHYSNLDPDRVLFEILNEPELSDRYRWYGIETKVAAAIRQAAPHHTIIATGALWSNDDNLLFLEPLRDSNVVYAFHFYEPHLFTHQGATWSVNYWRFLRGVPYPSDPENVKNAAEQLPDPVNRLAVVRYGLDRWNATRIDAEIAQVADWAKSQRVAVICNEFGVYRKYADPDARARWITDVRTSLEAHNIEWTMWDYDGTFGLVSKTNGQPAVDERTVQALGRSMPGRK